VAAVASAGKVTTTSPAGTAGKDTLLGEPQPATAAVPLPLPPPPPAPTPRSRLLPHLIIRLDAATDGALRANWGRDGAPQASEAADAAHATLATPAAPPPPPDAPAFERRLRRYRIHHAPTRHGVAAWFDAASAAVAGSCPSAAASVAHAVCGTALVDVRADACTPADVDRTIDMSVRHARSEVLRVLRAGDPLLDATLAQLDAEADEDGATTLRADDVGRGGEGAYHAPLPPTGPLEDAAFAGLPLEELAQLEALTAPARHDLMARPLPHVADGMVAVCSSDPPPRNPVLALARYLQSVAAVEADRAARRV
jgi:hypothetical protein